MSPHVIHLLTPPSLLLGATLVASTALWRALRLADEGYEDDAGFRFGRPGRSIFARAMRIRRKSAPPRD